jgi:hypothetical protein
MKGERAFRFPHRHRWEVRQHHVHQPSLGPMEAEQALDVFLD